MLLKIILREREMRTEKERQSEQSSSHPALHSLNAHKSQRARAEMGLKLKVRTEMGLRLKMQWASPLWEAGVLLLDITAASQSVY